MDDLTRTNADAARRLFEAVENLDMRVRSGTGKASGQPGIVSSLRKRVVLSHASSRRATTLRCCGDTGRRITKPESASICPPPASTASWTEGSSTPECSTSTSRRCSSF